MALGAEQPLISVILPVYNVEKLVTRTVESLIAQTWSIMAQLSRQKSKDFIMNIKPWHSLSALLDSTA